MFFLFLAELKTSDIWKNAFVMKNSMRFSNHDFDIFSHAFQHESFRSQIPVVWISNDSLKISVNDIFRIKQHYTNVKIFNKHVNFNEKKKLMIVQNFNDFFEIESMKFWFFKIKSHTAFAKFNECCVNNLLWIYNKKWN